MILFFSSAFPFLINMRRLKRMCRQNSFIKRADINRATNQLIFLLEYVSEKATLQTGSFLILSIFLLLCACVIWLKLPDMLLLNLVACLRCAATLSDFFKIPNMSSIYSYLQPKSCWNVELDLIKCVHCFVRGEMFLITSRALFLYSSPEREFMKNTFNLTTPMMRSLV